MTKYLPGWLQVDVGLEQQRGPCDAYAELRISDYADGHLMCPVGPDRAVAMVFAVSLSA